MNNLNHTESFVKMKLHSSTWRQIKVWTIKTPEWSTKYACFTLVTLYIRIYTITDLDDWQQATLLPPLLQTWHLQGSPPLPQTAGGWLFSTLLCLPPRRCLCLLSSCPSLFCRKDSLSAKEKKNTASFGVTYIHVRAASLPTLIPPRLFGSSSIIIFQNSSNVGQLTGMSNEISCNTLVWIMMPTPHFIVRVHLSPDMWGRGSFYQAC